MPAIRSPFSMLEWACEVAYATSLVVSPSWLTAPAVARHRAERIATSVASLAVPWITPPPVSLVDRNASGRSSSSCIQSSISVSTSVHAGEVTQLIPCTPSPADSSSPRIDGNDVLDGKYAKKPGCCHWVSPGTTTRSTSAITRSNGSGSVGGCSGSCERTSPGATVDPDRALLDRTDVVGDPVDQVVAVGAELVGRHDVEVRASGVRQKVGDRMATTRGREPRRAIREECS